MDKNRSRISSEAVFISTECLYEVFSFLEGKDTRGAAMEIPLERLALQGDFL